MKEKRIYEKPLADLLLVETVADLLSTSNQTKYDGKGEGVDLSNGGDSSDNENFEINSKEHWGDLWAELDESF